jgi:hypothetical protein
MPERELPHAASCQFSAAERARRHASYFLEAFAVAFARPLFSADRFSTDITTPITDFHFAIDFISPLHSIAFSATIWLAADASTYYADSSGFHCRRFSRHTLFDIFAITAFCWLSAAAARRHY